MIDKSTFSCLKIQLKKVHIKTIFKSLFFISSKLFSQLLLQQNKLNTRNDYNDNNIITKIQYKYDLFYINS